MPRLESVRELLQRRGVPDAAAKRDALASTRPPPRPGGPGPSGPGPSGPRGGPGPTPEKKPAPSPIVGRQMATPSRGEGGERRKVDQGRGNRHKQRVAEIRAQQAKAGGGGEVAKKPGNFIGGKIQGSKEGIMKKDSGYVKKA